jgi:hypothetical protein
MQNPKEIIKKTTKWLLLFLLSLTLTASIFDLGGIYHIYAILWTYLKICVQLPVPLWGVLALVLVPMVYTYIKIGKLNQSFKTPPSELNKKLKLEDYNYIEDPGYYIHKETKEKILW